MKAVIFNRHGGPEKLRYVDIDTPKPRNSEVLISVKACSINHLDIWVREGLPGVKIPKPHILGNDIAGTIERCGKEVEGFKKGDRVIVAPGMGCGVCGYCSGGWESLCASYNIIGFQIPGGYTQKIAVPARRVIKIPPQLSLTGWAATPLVFLTAWHMLHGHAKLNAKDTILIHGAGSGIGSAAIQIARLAGATVFTTVGHDNKMAKAEALGADIVINYNEEDFSQKIKTLTEGRGVDVIFEHIGPATWDKSLSSLAKGGRLVTCGATTGNDVAISLRHLFMNQQKIFGSYMGSRAELLQVMNLLKDGKLKPVIDSIFPLKDAREAHEHVESRNIFGKVILKVGGRI